SPLARSALADGLPGLDGPPRRVEVEAGLDIGVAAEEDQFPDRRAVVPLLAVDVARRVGEVDHLARREDALVLDGDDGAARFRAVVQAPPLDVAVAAGDDADDAPGVVVVYRRLRLVR